MIDPSSTANPSAAVPGEGAVRVFVLGAIYAAAVFVAVAFSPAIGFVALDHHGALSRQIAAGR